MAKTEAAEKPGSSKGDDDGPGMDKTELKHMLKFARREPVRVAFALDKEGKIVLIMDKRKQPRALDRELKETVEGGRNHRFGTVEIREDQPKLAIFMINKTCPGVARRIVMALKGTGCSYVEINTEDGGPVERHEEPDEDAIEEQKHALDRLNVTAPIAAKTIATAPDQRPPADKAAPAPVAKSSADASQPAASQTGLLVGRLVRLVRQIGEIVASHPEQKVPLQKLAAAAQTSLRKAMLTLEEGDLEHAAADTDTVEKAVQRAATAAKPPEEARPAEAQHAAAAKAQDVTDKLTEVAKKAVALMQADPSRASEIKGHLGKAHASLKSGDLTEAMHHTDNLSRLCAAGGNGRSNDGGNTHPDQDEEQPSKKSEKSRAALQSLSKLWLAAEKKVQHDLDALLKELRDLYDGDDGAPHMENDFQSHVDEINSKFDGSLAKELAAAATAKSESELAKCKADLKATISEHLSFITSADAIKMMDSNPLISLDVEKYTTAALTSMLKLVG